MLEELAPLRRRLDGASAVRPLRAALAALERGRRLGADAPATARARASQPWMDPDFVLELFDVPADVVLATVPA